MKLSKKLGQIHLKITLNSLKNWVKFSWKLRKILLKIKMWSEILELRVKKLKNDFLVVMDRAHVEEANETVWDL